MPTPAGHVLGGLAAAFLTNAAARHPALSPALVAACAAAAVAPDLDLLVGAHRSYSHSVGAAAIVGIASWLILRRRPAALQSALAIAAAYSSHMALDWLGKDTSRPPGLTVLWPFSSAYHMSGWDLFGEVSRRYWLPREFLLGNLGALAWEVVVIGPVVLLAWIWWSGRTLRSSQR